MSTALAFYLSLGFVLLLMGITVINYLKGRKALFVSSLFVLFVSALTHLVNNQWLSTLPAIDAIKIHYLFFAAVQVVLIAGLFWFNRRSLTVLLGISLCLLTLEVLLSYAVHVDRNIMALNHNLVPNLYSSKAWFLWDLRNFVVVANMVTILSALSLGKVYQVHIEDENEGFNLSLEVEAYTNKLPDSARKELALELLDGAANAFCYYGSEGSKPRIYTGEKLLKDAVQIVRYEPNNDNLSVFKKLLYWLRS